MLAPYGGLVTGPEASNWYATTAGAVGGVEGGEQGAQPAAIERHVIVRENQHLPERPGDPRVQCEGLSLTWLIQVAARQASLGPLLLDDRPGIVRGVVVHYEQLPSQSGGHIEIRQALERPSEQRRPVVGAQDDRGVHRRGLTAVPRAGVNALALSWLEREAGASAARLNNMALEDSPRLAASGRPE